VSMRISGMTDGVLVWRDVQLVKSVDARRM
jgi:hypothetical protein